ncbi:hypothetical protein GE21DRAFT_1279719 [Neurospora crassa]|nr:hypothetical protein GE21DRAFT_1279719 [Neurospora crassa]
MLDDYLGERFKILLLCESKFPKDHLISPQQNPTSRKSKLQRKKREKTKVYPTRELNPALRKLHFGIENPPC